MGQMFFFIKTLILTFIFVFLLQIRIGEGTIEEHTVDWFHHSAMAQPLQEVAQGGVVAIRNFWNRITGNIKTDFWESTDNTNQPGRRHLKFNLERSQKYLEEKAEEAREKAQEAKDKVDESRVVEWLKKATEESGEPREPEATY